MSKEEDRKNRNKDLINRMNKGESLANINLDESWYPIRPKIKKDKEALDFLNGTEKKKKKKLEEVKE